MARDQLPSENVEDFAAALKTIFRQAYPGEATSSTVLLQRFLTGLRASISQQVLLRKKPENLTEAIAIAAEVEYALSFDGGRKKKADDVNLLQRPSQDHEQPQANQLSRLQSSLDEMTKRIEALESALTTQNRDRRRFTRDSRVCFLCRQEGHIKRNCPLNYMGPAPRAGGWPGQY